MSVSRGSSKRDKKIKINILGEDTILERKGADGSTKKMKEIFKTFDEVVNAFGIGGLPFVLHLKGKEYPIPLAKKVTEGIKTKVVDGTSVKKSLERNIADYIENNSDLKLKGKKCYMNSLLDRSFMGESLEYHGVKMCYGDFKAALNIPIYLHSINQIDKISCIVNPILKTVPFDWLYPTGKKQENFTESKIKELNDADIIAGDFLYIKKNMPNPSEGKMIITNTTTEDDVVELKKRGFLIL